jgi:ubiquitin-protein ligase
MSPRSRRLLSDLGQMQALANMGELSFTATGDPADFYHVMLSCPGLALGSDGKLTIRRLHRCEIYMHLDYPRRPPVVTWLTPIFHPNILGPERNGGVCLGSWSAAESLADLCLRLTDLASYRSINTQDALNRDAARWAVANGVQPGADVQLLITFAVEVPATVGLAGG